MSTYRVLPGVDVPLASLKVLVPQPQSVGVQVTRRVAAGDGTVYDQGLFLDLRWTMVAKRADYMPILTDFGLHVASSVQVVVYAPDERWQWSRYNGIAILPQMGADITWANYFGRNATILVRNLSKLAEP